MIIFETFFFEPRIPYSNNEDNKGIILEKNIKKDK